MTSAQGLLTQADRILAGDTSLPKGQATRVAAWLIRAALELSVSDLLRGTIDNPERATMRSRLAALVSISHPTATSAAAAWTTLSRAAHHGGFALAPSAAEIRHWHDVVTTLGVQTIQPGSAHPNAMQ